MAQSDQNSPWLGLQATVPRQAWDDSFELSICLFDINGNVISHLTTTDHLDHPRVIVTSTDGDDDDSSDGEGRVPLRTRRIQFDLAAITALSSPTVMALSAGIITRSKTYLDRFASVGGRLELYVENPLGERPISLFEFPLLYSRETNNQILFSLLRNRSKNELKRRDDKLNKDTPRCDDPETEEHPLDKWLLRFSTNTEQPTNRLKNLAERFASEWAVSGTLIRHQSFQGCLPLKRLVTQSLSRMNNVNTSGSDVEKDYSSRQFNNHMWPNEWRLPPSYSDGQGNLVLPFDRISWMLKCLYKKQNHSDQNIRDLAEMMGTLISTINTVGNERSITARLCDGIENLETLFFEMYQQATEKARIFEELVAGSVLDLDLKAEDGRHSTRESDLTSLQGINGDSIPLTKEEIHIIETFQTWKDYHRTGRIYDRSNQRYELYSQYVKGLSATRPSPIQRLLGRVKEPYSLENSHTARQSEINQVPIQYPPETEALHTLIYDEAEL